MDAAIHVQKLNAWFGNKQALFDINLEVPEKHEGVAECASR